VRWCLSVRGIVLRELSDILVTPWQEQRLANASALIDDLLDNQTIVGLFMGDELVWNCLTPSDLILAANAVRTAFPRERVSTVSPAVNGIAHVSKLFPTCITKKLAMQMSCCQPI